MATLFYVENGDEFHRGVYQVLRSYRGEFPGGFWRSVE